MDWFDRTRNIAFPILALFALTCAAQDVPPPPKPADDGPSLADTMKFIEEKLGSIGRVNYVWHAHDDANGTDEMSKFGVEISNVRTSVQGCRTGAGALRRCAATCPVRNVQSWLEQAGISTGPLFRSINRHGQVQPGRLSGIDVARIVKTLAQRAGLDSVKFAGHSLRAGHATSAAIAGASERSIHEPDRASVGSDGTAIHQGG